VPHSHSVRSGQCIARAAMGESSDETAAAHAAATDKAPRVFVKL
jgi:hypothetical protein